MGASDTASSGIVRTRARARPGAVRRRAEGAARSRRDFVLVDVREPREWAISDLGDSVKIPLGTLPESLEKLSKDDEIVVYCRTGGRSGNAVAFLLEHGFEKVRNLAGGINRWADRIDKSLPRY